MRVMFRSAWSFALAVFAGCGQPVCYPSAEVPRFSGRHAPLAGADAVRRLRVVSFNVELAKQADAAANLLSRHPELRLSDVVLLQEMDEDGTEAIARRLGLDYVYYPAIRHPKRGLNFGNAVLSRFPIVADKKLVLPGQARFGGAIRTATLAEIAVGEGRVTVVSTHLSTPFELGFGSRRAQLDALYRAVSKRAVIIGGDFNDPELPLLLSQRGFFWPTRGIGGTSTFGRSIDHILARGFAHEFRGAGKVKEIAGISDHVPVYADVMLKGRRWLVAQDQTRVSPFFGG
jgi:endonuclease/exonuclease/phosphatase family metal-dependent hydrolase